MIPNSYTVVNPRAMVIVSFYTVVANSAVFRPTRADDFTVRAHFAGMDFLE